MSTEGISYKQFLKLTADAEAKAFAGTDGSPESRKRVGVMDLAWPLTNIHSFVGPAPFWPFVRSEEHQGSEEIPFIWSRVDKPEPATVAMLREIAVA